MLTQNLFRLSEIIYIYIVLFGPVKPELGVIPSGQENHSGAEHLRSPVIFFFVFSVHTRNEEQDGNQFIILK